MNLGLPTFNLALDHVENNLKTLLDDNLKKIDALCDQPTHTWDTLLQPLEDQNDALHQFWSPISHMNAVVNSPKLREIMNLCLPLLSDYHTKIGHHKKLFQAIEAIKNSEHFASLSEAQQTSINDDLRDFKLNGVALSPEKKTHFSDITRELSQQTHLFEEHLLDATMAFKKHITNEKDLFGIPAHARERASALAKKENLSGYVFTLEAPDYLAIMLHADSRELRKEIYHAFVTRASEIGPNAGQFDNSLLMHDIMKNRFALAQLLGFKNFAEYSLATKMVKKPQAVLDFLNELANKSILAAKKEFQTLSEFAKNTLKIEVLSPWDVAYASEKLRQQAYDISPEDLRPYFPESKVRQGLFTIIEKLFDVHIEKADNIATWHPDVSCFRLLDKNKTLQAHLYFDLYTRPNKRGGAWMDECMIRRRLSNDSIQLPAAYVTCNFNGPIGDNPALFSHDDVVTLFHECGHALQHMLTKIDVANVSGIRNIPWDAVEIASQFLENWAWEKESIPYIAKHYQTQEALPETLYTRMDNAKNFQSAMQMMRQLEFALFDFRLHMEFDEKDPTCLQRILDEVRAQLSVVPIAPFNRFQHGFSHIFSGGYAAGYYSYKWAEVMACDAFSLFEEKGVFNHSASEKFKQTFLESGGAKDPMDLFIAFRGRKPSVDALLRQSGIR